MNSLALGDLTLCAKQWDDPSYAHDQLSDVGKK